jgi:deoxyribodipyrimidine photolyase
VCLCHRLFCLKHGRRVFAEHGITGERREWRDDVTALQRWREGATGIPFVDAHMRELHQTGVSLQLHTALDWQHTQMF